VNLAVGFTTQSTLKYLHWLAFLTHWLSPLEAISVSLPGPIRIPGCNTAAWGSGCPTYNFLATGLSLTHWMIWS